MRKQLARFLTWLIYAIDPPATALAFVFFDGATIHKVQHMNTQITDNGSTVLLAHCVSAAGNTVAVTPSWSSSDPSVVAVTPSVDGLSATVSATGKLGVATITVTAGHLAATDDVTVVAGEPATLTISEALTGSATQ